MIRIFLLVLLPIFITSCSSIKVGNIAFSTKEICSAEYVNTKVFIPSRSLGCLPPQRFSNVGKFHFTKQRPLLSASELQLINFSVGRFHQDYQKVLSSEDVQNILKENSYSSSSNGQIKKFNVAPSLIGRIFSLKDKSPPSTGDFTFYPLDHNNIKLLPTEVLLSTELEANEELIRKAGLDLNLREIIKTTLESNKVRQKFIDGITDQLVDATLDFERQKSINSTSLGKFQYVSIENSTLDHLVNQLKNRCWLTDTTDTSCLLNESKQAIQQVDHFNLNNYVSDLAEPIEKGNSYGLIIGASIINTSGDSNQCLGNDVSVVVNERTAEQGTLQGCVDLIAELEKKLIKQVTQNVHSSESSKSATKDEVDDVIKVVSENATNIASAYIQRKSRAYKTLRIHGHSSVLAIQYVVLKKCMNEKTCK